jgi:hypothetical protein
MPSKQKPASLWITAKQPKMAEFLDEDVRRIVQARWDDLVAHDGILPKRKQKARDLPSTSRYFLSRLIRISGTDRVMTGYDGSTRGDKSAYRYYASRRCSDAPVAGAPSERLSAELIEGKVKEALRIVLQDVELHRSKIVQYIEEKKQELLGRTDDTAGLRDEKQRLESWYRSTFSIAGTRGQELLKSDAKQVEQRLDEIDIQLANAGSASPDFLSCTVSEVVTSIRNQFAELDAVVNGACCDSMRRLATSLCSQITYDPVNRVIDIEIALPSWALSKRHLLSKYVGTEETLRPTSFLRTDNEKVVLLHISCDLIGQRSPCMQCRRSDRLAA